MDTRAGFLMVTLCVAGLNGCAAQQRDFNPSRPFVSHIAVPYQYSSADSCDPGLGSSIDYYVHSYEQAWWDCLEKYAKNINYHSVPADYRANGWAAELAGYRVGYAAARRRIHAAIERYGKPKTEKLLRKWVKPFD